MGKPWYALLGKRSLRRLRARSFYLEVAGLDVLEEKDFSTDSPDIDLLLIRLSLSKGPIGRWLIA
jgi:hypothetical protein